MFGVEFLLNEDCYYDKINLHSNIFLENVREAPIVIDFLAELTTSAQRSW